MLDLTSWLELRLATVHSMTDVKRRAMERTLVLARKCESEPGRISPKVGAVLVQDDEIVGEAFRGETAPGDHAEFTLLESKLAKAAVAGATLYTTLEPCTARSENKIPCADRIIERRIRRVVIGVLDPNPDIVGSGELRLRDAGIEVARYDSDLMSQIEELNREFSRLHRPLARSRSQRSDPSGSVELGPNGYPVAYTERGDKVELIDDRDDPDGTFSLLLRRNDDAIVDAYQELWDKVWWNRHQNRLHRIESGETRLTDEQVAVVERAKTAAAEIERKYGRENLGWDDFEWGLLSGRMSALAWVLGTDWEETLDT